MESFEFSVLLPVYHGNTANEFSVAVDSIISQTLPPPEIIIVQDGPVDTAISEKLEEFEKKPGVKVIRLPENTGVGNALNEGLKYCTFDWVARMDADDRARADRFEITVKYIMDNPGLDLVGTYYAEQQTNGEAFIRKVPVSFDEILEFADYRNPHSHPTVFYRKSVVNGVGGYKNFYFAEDWYLWLRMFRMGSKSANIPQVLVYAQNQNYSRRLGWRALKNDYKAIRGLYKERLINLPEFLANISVRFFVRLLPAKLANIFYKKYLRSAEHN